MEKLDRNIDTIRNYKSEVSIITEKEKQLRNLRDRGALGAIVQLYEKGSKKLELQAAHLKSQIDNYKILIGLLPDEADANSLKQRALEVQLETVERLIAARNSEIPKLAASAEIIKRQLDVEKASLSLLEERLDILDSTTELYSDIRNAESFTIQGLQDQLQLRRFITEEALRTLNIEIKLLENEIAREKLSKDLNTNTRAKEVELIEKKLEADKIQLENLREQKRLRQEIIEAENNQLGRPGMGLTPAFAGLDDPSFMTRFRAEMANIADEMGERIGNSINQTTRIFTSAMETVTDTLIDAIMTNEWDGKEEGRSMGVAIREALKDSLRQSIGQALKDTMNQAIAILIGKQDQQIVAINQEIIELRNNSAQLQINSSQMSSLTAVMASQGGGDRDSNLMVTGAQALAGSGNTTSGQTNTTANPHLAKGGIITEPTTALIGEGVNSEAVVPLPDNRSIPVKMEGSSENISVTQNFDFRNADSATEGRLRQFAQQIKKDTIRELTDSINRGGSMAKTVGRR